MVFYSHGDHLGVGDFPGGDDLPRDSERRLLLMLDVGGGFQWEWGHGCDPSGVEGPYQSRGRGVQLKSSCRLFHSRPTRGCRLSAIKSKTVKQV